MTPTELRELAACAEELRGLELWLERLLDEAGRGDQVANRREHAAAADWETRGTDATDREERETMRTPRLTMLAALAALCLMVLAPPVMSQTAGWPADSGTGVVVNPRVIRAELSEHGLTLLDGSPAVTGYVLGWYAQGASGPTSTTPMAKTIWTLVVGTQYCYEAPLPPLAGVPMGQAYVGALRALRGTEESPWSAASNPFGFQGPVVVPSRVTLRK